MTPSMAGSDQADTVAPSTPLVQPSGDRRSLLKAGLAALAGTLAPAIARAQGVPRLRPAPLDHHPSQTGSTIDAGAAPSPYVNPIDAWHSLELRLVRRLTMGLDDAEARRATQLGFSGYLEYQLAADAIDDGAVDQFVATNYPMALQGVDTLYNANAGTVQTQLTQATIFRAAFSARQLKERLVELWSDHFNIALSKVGYLKIVDDRDVIRANAMTSFPQLLLASAHSPAMLAYLDQTQSRRGAPNQNYAREIMELHTLGVNGGYTQTDVAELSRVLTGWTIAGHGTYTFDPNLHDFGAKTVLGVTIPATATTVGAAAQNEGERMLAVLSTHPSTARFVATKMLRHFLRYDPTDEQISGVAAVYTRTNGDIKAMLRAIFAPLNLLAAPAKFKRPFHLVTSGLRAMNPAVTGMANVAAQVSAAGQQPFTWQTPDGFPDRIDYWSGNLVPRWNYASYIANANAADVRVDITPFMTPAVPESIVGAINRHCFGGEMTRRLHDELVAYVSVAPASAARVRETLALALSSSTFQYF